MFDELKRDEYTDEMIRKYNVRIKNKTMIINKKIPVVDFVRLRNKLRDIEEINEVIVDAEFNYNRYSI